MGELSRHWRRYVLLAVLFLLPMLVMISWSYAFEQRTFMGATAVSPTGITTQDWVMTLNYIRNVDIYDRPIARLSVYVEIPWVFFVGAVLAPMIMLPKEDKEEK
jgi:hypothetical protein